MIIYFPDWSLKEIEYWLAERAYPKRYLQMTKYPHWNWYYVL